MEQIRTSRQTPPTPQHQEAPPVGQEKCLRSALAAGGISHSESKTPGSPRAGPLPSCQLQGLQQLLQTVAGIPLTPPPPPQPPTPRAAGLRVGTGRNTGSPARVEMMQRTQPPTTPQA